MLGPTQGRSWGRVCSSNECPDATFGPQVRGGNGGGARPVTGRGMWCLGLREYCRV